MFSKNIKNILGSQETRNFLVFLGGIKCEAGPEMI